MITSKKLTPERIKEIMDFPVSYGEESFKLSKDQIARMKPVHREYWNVEPVKVSISIKIDADILDWFKSKGKGYQTRINKALRDVMQGDSTKVG